MRTERIKIGGIPAIVWGEKSNKAYIHVHGKQSRKEYAENFAVIASRKGYQTISFDLPEHGERTDSSYRCDIFNGKTDLKIISNYVFNNWNEVSLFACSLGAFFSLNTYNHLNFKKALFQSPIVDMKFLINKMFESYDVNEKMLFEKKEIVTPLDTLRWDYYQYVLANPIINWDIKTTILYGGQDNMQSLEVINEFANKFNCRVEISENSKHPFMDEQDFKIVEEWLEKHI